MHSVSPKDEKMRIVLFVAVYFLSSVLLSSIFAQYSSSITLYMVLEFFSITFAFINDSHKKAHYKNSLLFTLLYLLIPFIIFAYRASTGLDDPSYQRMFYSIIQGGGARYFSDTFVEPGYVLLLSIIGKFTNDYINVQIVTALIPFAIIGRALCKMKKSVNCSAFIYVFYMFFYYHMLSVNLSRMFIAIAIVLLGITYLMEGDKKKYIIYVIAAAFFHYSALFMLLFSYLSEVVKKNVKKKSWTIFIYLMIPVAFIIIGRYIIPLMGNRHGSYTLHVPNISDLIGCLTKLPTILLFSYGIKYIDFDSEESNKAKILNSIFCFSVMIEISGLFIDFGRLIFYTNICMVIEYALLTKHIRNGKYNIMLTSLITAYGFLNLYVTQFLVKTHATTLLPYRGVLF